MLQYIPFIFTTCYNHIQNTKKQTQKNMSEHIRINPMYSQTAPMVDKQIQE